jgi:hypothetical protein
LPQAGPSYESVLTARTFRQVDLQERQWIEATDAKGGRFSGKERATRALVELGIVDAAIEAARQEEWFHVNGGLEGTAMFFAPCF